MDFYLPRGPYGGDLCTSLRSPGVGERYRICFLHEHNVVHRVYGDLTGVMIEIGHPTAAEFHCSALSVGLLRIALISRRHNGLARCCVSAPHNANFCHDVSDCGSGPSSRCSYHRRSEFCRGSGGRPGPPDQGNTARAAGAQRASALTLCLVQIQYIR